MGFTLISFLKKAVAPHTRTQQPDKDVTYLGFVLALSAMLFFVPASASASTSQKPLTLPSNIRNVIFDKHLPHLKPYEHCLVETVNKSQIPEMLLLSILLQENGRTGKYSVNRDKTKDYGLGQINDVRAKEIASIGLTLKEVMNDGCKNIIAVAYLLTNEFQKANGNLWTAVGNYHYSKHGKYPKNHYKYINNVHQKWSLMFSTIKQASSN